MAVTPGHAVTENFRDRGMELAFSPTAALAACLQGVGPTALLSEAPQGPLASLSKLLQVVVGKLTDPLGVMCAIGAVALVFLMRPNRAGVRMGATVLALAAFAGLFVEVLKRAGGAGDGGIPPVFPVIFGFLALAGAVRMITHPRPVFAALYFILVVIATGGMFLLLGAEFMAFALIIVYAGAILITYMFVLMLAQQSPVAGAGEAWYDRMPREAVPAVFVGFLMVMTLTDAFFSPDSQAFRTNVAEQSAEAGAQEGWARLESMPKLLLETAKQRNAQVASVQKLEVEGMNATAIATLADGSSARVELDPSMLPDNGRQVGVELVSRFPAGLEIAGVVLLMALFGAVILARKQIELGEDERRGLAGMRRFTVDGEAGGTGGMR
jgi:NADH-quinone oxidoreductase subunit J